MNFQDILKGIQVIEVRMNDEVWGYYTNEAYQELRLQMSTHVHTTRQVYVQDYNNVITTLDME